MNNLTAIKLWSLNEHTLYRIPPSSVSYSPALGNARVWFTGRFKDLPADGGTMAEFRFANPSHTWQGSNLLWLRPFAVVRVD